MDSELEGGHVGRWEGAAFGVKRGRGEKKKKRFEGVFWTSPSVCSFPFSSFRFSLVCCTLEFGSAYFLHANIRY